MKSTTTKTTAEASELKHIVSGGSDSLHIFVLIFIAAFVLLWRLGAGSLADWDEAIYGQISKEMVQQGDWLTLHWQYKPWFEKPPLLMWTTAVFYRLFGVDEFWSRAASAFSGIWLIVVTYLIGKFAYSKWVGLFAAVILLTCYQFVFYARYGTTDTMLTLFTYAGIYAYLRLKDGDQKWWYLVWLFCALAFMAKGIGSIVAPAAVALALLLDKRLVVTVQSKQFWQGCLLAFVVVAPWHIAMYVQHGQPFIDEYLGYHAIARATTALEGHSASYFFYVRLLISGIFPWSALVPFAIALGVKENITGKLRAHILLVTVILVLGLYTMVQTKLPWYIVPIYPALAILIASLCVQVYQTYKTYRRMIVLMCTLLTVIGGAYSFLRLYLYESAQPVAMARLARLAESTSAVDRDSLVLFSESEALLQPTALFYSNRPLQQAYVAVKPVGGGAKRYYNFEDLADITRSSAKRIILRREYVELLSKNYEIYVLAEADPLVYATINPKD